MNKITIVNGKKSKKELILEYDIKELNDGINSIFNLFISNKYVKVRDKSNNYLNQSDYNNECNKVKTIIENINDDYLTIKLNEFPKKLGYFDVDKSLTIQDINCSIYSKNKNIDTWELYSLKIVAIEKSKLKLVLDKKIIKN